MNVETRPTLETFCNESYGMSPTLETVMKYIVYKTAFYFLHTVISKLNIFSEKYFHLSFRNSVDTSFYYKRNEYISYKRNEKLEPDVCAI